MNIVTHTIEVRCRADAIPACIEVDVGDLEINHSKHLSDIELPRRRARGFAAGTSRWSRSCRRRATPKNSRPRRMPPRLLPPLRLLAAGTPAGGARRDGAPGAAPLPAGGAGRGRRRQEVRFARTRNDADAAPGRTGQSGSALCRQPPQHRLHGRRGDRASATASRRGAGVFRAWRAEGPIGGERALLLLPGTFMNESGRAVAEAAHFYKLAHRRASRCSTTRSICRRARCRVKIGGGIAGHNGLRSISAHIGNDYRRVRIGIGHPGDKDLVAQLRARAISPRASAAGSRR